MSDRPLFLAPLRLEARAVRRGAPGAQVEQIGMGPVRATAARARAANEQTLGRPIVLIGFGGALVSELKAGDLVVAQSLGSTETDETFALEQAENVCQLLGEAGLSPHLAPIVSSPALLRGDEARQKAAASGAHVVDMESLWCAPLACRHPFAVVRAVVDVPGTDVRSLSTPGAAWKAYRALVAASRALAGWLPNSLIEYPLLEVGDS